MELTRETFKEEYSRFQRSFKEDAFDIAKKSLTFERRGNVGFIVFDQYQEKANKLSTPNMLRIFELLMQVEEDKAIGCLVIWSKKPSIFIAGADIAEISTLASGTASVDSLSKLQSVFSYLEALPIPSIAAIHGACMGGGTELSLACDYRIATDAPETKIGLPEVQLGILPGWGGTFRMPRLIGLEKSLDLILSGRAVDGKKAKRMGLVDKLASKEFLEDKVMAWAEELSKTKKKRRDYHRELKEKVLETVPGGKWIIFDQAKKSVVEKTKGNYPAPLVALETIKKSYGGTLEAGLKAEAEAFEKLMVTPESQNLIKVFYLNEKAKKDKGVSAAVNPIEIRRTAVVGAGVMGGGIAQLFSEKNVRVRMKDINWDSVTKGFQHAYKIFKKKVDRRRLRPNELDNAMARIEGTLTYEGFKHLDLVVEAVVEDLEIKKRVFKDLADRSQPTTLLCTNTSSLPITSIAEGVVNPERVVGMHFFNPVDKMPLIEVIRGKQTSDLAVASVVAFSKKLGKTPIVVKDSPGFVVNRILGPYLVEATYLLLEGVSVSQIDGALEKFGMPMGPVTLLDVAGLDVTSKVSKVLYGAFGERMKPPALMDVLVSDGRLGQKVGKGIFLYDSKGTRLGEDPTVWTKLGIKPGKTKLSDETIVKRLIYLMINEAARCLAEEVVRDPADIDIGMIFGTGFAPFRGGLLNYADSVGAENIVSDLELFVHSHGTKYAPCEYLQQLSVGKKTFFK